MGRSRRRPCSSTTPAAGPDYAIDIALTSDNDLRNRQRPETCFLKQRGLHKAIDYRTQDRSNFADSPEEKASAHHGSDRQQEKSYRLRSTGRLGMFGISAATNSGCSAVTHAVIARMPFFTALAGEREQKRLRVNLGHMWHEGKMLATWMPALLQGVADGWIRPHVDKTFPLARAGDAHAYIEERKNIGKIVLVT